MEEMIQNLIYEHDKNLLIGILEGFNLKKKYVSYWTNTEIDKGRIEYIFHYSVSDEIIDHDLLEQYVNLEDLKERLGTDSFESILHLEKRMEEVFGTKKHHS